ncbi:MAG: hypothetical protein EA356_05335 [Geminicoccaceae bacterium]|nr:MAG: hypothetical protein EA356_05335 [Geminicoccaceae bacterium]
MKAAAAAALLVGLGAAALADDAPLVLQQLSCRGEAPAWSIEANATTALAAGVRGEAIHSGVLGTLGAPAWAVFDGAELTLVARAETCSLGGELFDHVALALWGDGTRASGCCRARIGIDLGAAPLADLAGKPAADWSRLALDLEAVLRACVIDGGVAVERVAMAWPMNHGLALARLVDGAGGRHDCIADIATGRIERVAPVAEAERMPGEDAPGFWPAREAPPLFTCGWVEALPTAGGHLLGWLHYGGPCG